MQRRQTLLTMGFPCLILILSLLASAGCEGNINGQQSPPTVPTLTAVVPVVTATQLPPAIPTLTAVVPVVTATQLPPAIPTLTVNARSLDPNSAYCSSNGDGTYTCNVTVGESPQSYLHWSVMDKLRIPINPSSGQLTPAQPTQQVTFNSIPCQNDTFTFSDQGGNTISVTWSCVPRS